MEEEEKAAIILTNIIITLVLILAIEFLIDYGITIYNKL